MSGANDNDMTLARRISVLERGIETSLRELAEVEAAINARDYPRPLEGGGLERRRLMLLGLLEEMRAKLKELRPHRSHRRQFPSQGGTARAAFLPVKIHLAIGWHSPGTRDPPKRSNE